MAHRRSLLAIVLLAASLHAVGIARTLLPAQDGLKLIRFARQFQTRVRGPTSSEAPTSIRSTRHWSRWSSRRCRGIDRRGARRLAAGRSARRGAGLARRAGAGLLPHRVAVRPADRIHRRRACWRFCPRVAEVGHETLADSLGLFATFMALWLAARALTRGDRRCAIGSGVFAGLGYLARPEVILVPAVDRVDLARRSQCGPGVGRDPAARSRPSLMLLMPALAVCGYAAVKGEVSEKLSLRSGAGLGPQTILARSGAAASAPRAGRPALGLLAQGGVRRMSRSGVRGKPSSGSSADGGRRWPGSSP